MAQVLKAEVRERIERAALTAFAERGYPAASMASIAAEAGTATANVYRYFPDKAALFAAVLPPGLVERHDAVLDARVGALVETPAATDDTAQALLDFWIEQRLQVVILLDRAEGTPYADYPAAFVARLAAPFGTLEGDHRAVVELVFDNTRRALAHILRGESDPAAIRARIAGFWSYQLPGLDGLAAWVATGARARRQA